MSEQAASDPAAGEASYDATGLRALQAELRRLNAAARADGLLGDAVPPERSAPDAADPAPRKRGKAARKRGKAAARRLLDLAARGDDDDSPDVPGTGFTEAGIVRLVARLRRRREGDGAWPRFLQRVQRALGRPVPDGQHLVAGVGLARLQIAYRQIVEIEAHGLAHLATRRAIRRGRVLQASALTLGDKAPPLGVAPSKPPSSKPLSSKPSPKKSPSKKKPPAKKPPPSKQGGSR